MGWFSKRSEPTGATHKNAPAPSAAEARRAAPAASPTPNGRQTADRPVPPPAAAAAAPRPTPPAPLAPQAQPADPTPPPGADTDPTRTFAALMRIALGAPQTQGMTVSQLRALLEPAIAAGQFLVASQGMAGAAVLWAMTDTATDARLRTDLGKPFDIAPTDWRNGPHAWIVAVLGDQPMARQLIDMIQTSMLAGAPLYARVAGPDGAPAVATFESRPKMPA